MTVLLLANVGNSDVLVEGAAPQELPRDARPLAGRLRAERAAYWPRLRLPILAKAVDYVLAQEGALDALVLFVSDQDRALVGDGEWAKDTCDLFDLVRDKLREQYAGQKWTAKQVRRETLEGNPADYDVTLAYFQSVLPRIAGYYQDAPLRAYLSLTGGTPAMNAMLLVVGNEVFGERAVSLYDAKGRRQPFPLGVGRRLARRPLVAALRANLDTYQYAAARALAEGAGQALVDSDSARRVLAAVLAHAHHRLAFNWDEAVRALDAALPHAPAAAKDRLLLLQNQLVRPTPADLLRELLHSADVELGNQDYAAWLERVFRFQESALRQACTAHGVRFRDRGAEYLDLDWVKAQRGLDAWLRRSPRPGGTGVDPARSASRPLLRAILAYLADRDGDAALADLLALSDRLEGLAALRNDWVHRSEGVRLVDVQAAFGGSPAEAAQVLAGMYAVQVGRVPGDSPYAAANRLCLEIVEEAARG